MYSQENSSFSDIFWRNNIENTSDDDTFPGVLFFNRSEVENNANKARLKMEAKNHTLNSTENGILIEPSEDRQMNIPIASIIGLTPLPTNISN